MQENALASYRTQHTTDFHSQKETMRYMCFSKLPQRTALLLAVSPFLLATPCAPAKAQQGRFGPDQLQTLSIGARAIGMGSAYSVIANDSSATFWNPACLDNVLGKRQFDIEYRTVSQATNRTLNGVSVAGYPQFNVNDPQISFIGFAAPLQIQKLGKLNPVTGTRPKTTKSLGTLGFSYALGGYANLSNNSTDIVGNITTNTNVTSIVRNSIFTAAYGNNVLLNHGSGKFQYGAGVFFVSQDQLLSQSGSIVNNMTNTTLSNTPPTPASDHADGVGFLIGATYRQDYHNKKTNQLTPGQWIYGVSYRSGPNLSGAKTSLRSFDSEMPDRVAVGTAYDGKFHSLDGFTFATEVQRLSSANLPTELDVRRYVTNFNVGMEYVPNKFNTKADFLVPIRLGFHTIANGNTNLFSYDDAVTFGAGFQTKNANGISGVVASLEGALEYLTISHKLQYNLSARFRF
jgi:hypothetical protein